MNVEVFLTGKDVTEEDVKGRTVVVIDVLRTSSTITTALHFGARSVVPVADTAEAGKIAANLDSSSYLMGGERDGLKIEGYHLGNSPLEYVRSVVQNRTIILNTTNGTGAIIRARAAEDLVIGCLLNADRVVQFVRERARDVVIICSGWRNRLSLEDTLCAGLILYQLWNGQEPLLVTDTAHIAFSQYLNDREQLQDAIRQCNQAQHLYEQGFHEDVDYCARLNALPLLPIFKDRQLVLHMDPLHEVKPVPSQTR